MGYPDIPAILATLVLVFLVTQEHQVILEIVVIRVNLVIRATKDEVDIQVLLVGQGILVQE